VTALIILVVVSLIGIGAAFWLLKSEQESEGLPLINKAEPLESAQPAVPKAKIQAPGPKPKPPISAQEPRPKSIPLAGLLTGLKEKLGKTQPPSAGKKDLPAKEKSSSLLKKLLSKFSREKDGQANGIPDVSHLPSFADTPIKKKPQTGTASITTAPASEPAQAQNDVWSNLNLSAELDELKKKYERLDALLKEKTSQLEESQKSLDTELRTRKEFNKVKDILEGEIKDLKDKMRSAQSERDSAKTESEGHRKRAEQSEEKISRLEKDLQQKEDKITELVKRLQTFASPATASTPPTVEKPRREEAPLLPEPQPEPAQMSEPPESDGQEEAPEETEEEKVFLKLQPDVLSQQPKQNSPIADEIEESLAPKEKKILKIIDPEQKPENPPTTETPNP